MVHPRAVSVWLVALYAGAALSGCGYPDTFNITADRGEAEKLRKQIEVNDEAGPAAAVERPDPTGWATLRGAFKLEGTPPPRRPLTVTADMAVCAPGGKAPLDEQVVIGPDSGIQNVLVYVTTSIPDDDPQWEHESYADDKFAEVIFDQKDCVFLSRTFAMRSTQRLKILNSDPVGHNTKLDPRRGARTFNQTIPANGFTFYEPGGEAADPFPVSCSIHPWMAAWMITRDNPYFAVTAADGSFEIAHLPAGVELEFRVWQEKAKFLSQVQLNGKDEDWSRGRFTLTLEPDQTHEMNVVVEDTVFQ